MTAGLVSPTTGAVEGIDGFILKRHSASVLQIGDERLLKTIATDAYGRLVGITLSVWNKELFSQVIHYQQHRSRIAGLKLKYGGVHQQVNVTYTPDGFLQDIHGQAGQRSKFGYDQDGHLVTVIENDSKSTIK